jgi:PAT family beta-lactamase induction signal transducer AmpG
MPAASAWNAVWNSLKSWRTASVTLMAFASGLPLGLVWIAIPTWLARAGVDIKIIGLFTLAQAPWSFKFLWSPLMDRFAPPVKLSRNLAWTLVFQIVLLALILGLAGLATHPDAIWMIGALTLAIAFASASQDIAIDAYAVQVLEPHEMGTAGGARTAVYRTAMYISGGVAITFAGLTSWPFVFALLALLYLPMMLVTRRAPRVAENVLPAPSTLREAVWDPFVGFLSKVRALEILAFVILYKLADNLAGALVRPFLVHVGFNDFDVGIATATIGLVATLLGTLLGGVLTTAMGMGHALWVFGLLQIVSNVGYVVIAEVGLNRPIMYAAMGFESLTSSMGTGAFAVLLLRLTQKQFSITQYALLSSLFALPRIFSGPVAGVAADAFGWSDFFLLTMAFGIPGMIFLHRFSPLGMRDPALDAEVATKKKRLTQGQLLARAAVGTVVGFGFAVGAMALHHAFDAMRKKLSPTFDYATNLQALFAPRGTVDWIELFGILVFALLTGLTVAATSAARRRH